MARVQFNPSTQKVLFNPDTQKVLMVAAECGHCVDIATDGITPTLLKVDFSGILSCYGFNCCAATIRRNTDYGVGWNNGYILEQGLVDWDQGVPYWRDNATIWPCWWSAIYTGDYGGYDQYNLENCQGGLVEHYDFYGCVPRVSIGRAGDDLQANVWYDLNAKGAISGNCLHRQIFGANLNFGSSPAKCMPYGTDIPNGTGFRCEGDPMPCFGDGIATITEWPPP